MDLTISDKVKVEFNNVLSKLNRGTSLAQLFCHDDTEKYKHYFYRANTAYVPTQWNNKNNISLDDFIKFQNQLVEDGVYSQVKDQMSNLRTAMKPKDVDEQLFNHCNKLIHLIDKASENTSWISVFKRGKLDALRESITKFMMDPRFKLLSNTFIDGVQADVNSMPPDQQKMLIDAKFNNFFEEFDNIVTSKTFSEASSYAAVKKDYKEDKKGNFIFANYDSTTSTSKTFDN
ncbi:hypothetical protein L3V82_10515 [Thiotrichales bacterium 19S3-7]|nr:hypothetical protein [Thiotrichales bacterium 19S3-7]MCF6802589.1 hypothetical protein [Thiotrichales bacterium 19S3-11]